MVGRSEFWPDFMYSSIAMTNKGLQACIHVDPLKYLVLSVDDFRQAFGDLRSV